MTKMKTVGLRVTTADVETLAAGWGREKGGD